MKIVNQTSKIISKLSGYDICQDIEYAGRNCYASHHRMSGSSYESFIDNMISRQHFSPMEFGDLTFDITTSRAVLAEMTRHRLASFCVQSQRYIQEAKTGDITFIKPTWYSDEEDHLPSDLWYDQMCDIEDTYIKMIKAGMKPQEAREVLPNSTACRIIMKANIRQWRKIFELRCDVGAYPQMRELAKMMLEQAHEYVPVVFDDLYEKFCKD